ncbi:hypothetical protein BBJ28_00002158 [Nothophytophthora sp. Chile5]|nr:hypothetical protein BBJ28_00002158 [Nothophytophthora sp. Chile5]
MEAVASPADAAGEVARLRSEVHAKEEALNALKAKTKAFVDNMRGQLAEEKQKVVTLEHRLQQSTAVATPTPTPTPTAENGSADHQRLSDEIEKLKKETAVHENELKARAKSFADAMNLKLQAEQHKTHELEVQLQQQAASLTLAEAAAAAAAAAERARDTGPLIELMSVPAHSDEEVMALQVQLDSATREVDVIRERLQNVEAGALQSSQEAARSRQDLEKLRISEDEERCRLQEEVDSLKSRERELENALSTLKESRDKTEESGQLEAAAAKNQELEYQLEQHKIENKHLQKQLSDKDFQLEQSENYRQRADDSESKVIEYRGEIAGLQSQLQAKCDELAAFSCGKCAELESKLSEMSQLYEKVNLGRSRSDSLIAEVQSELGELQTIKQQYQESQDRIEEITRQNVQLTDSVAERDAEVATLKAEMKKWSVEMADLQMQHSVLKSDSTDQRQRSDSATAEYQKAEEIAKDLQTRCAQLEKKNQELAASIEAINKENTDKRQKAKALVQSLVGEKTHLLDTKNDLQTEVDRLRMELNQRNVENEQQRQQLREESNEKAAQSASTLQSLNDEISTLKHTLATVQESEKLQQRAKELAAAKREIDDSNKKRLAAKAETQKLAVELENAHKCLDHLSSHVNANCTESVQQMNLLQGHVKEAIELLEKRAAATNQGKNSQLTNQHQDDTDAESRKPEAVSGTRMWLRLLVDITEKLCDMAMEQNDINLKDAVVSKLTQMFTQCFSEKIMTAYTKADEAVSLLASQGSTSDSNSSAVRPTT